MGLGVYNAMTFNFDVSKIRSLRPGDAGFNIKDGLRLASRASLEITKNCPGEHKWIIQQCIENGWIKPVAHVYDHELVWDTLQSS